MVKKKLIYIDQLVGPTSLDIVNALTRYYEVHLYYGGIIKTYNDLDQAVRLHKRIAYRKTNFAARCFSWFAYYFTTLPLVLLQRNKDSLFLVSNPPLNFFVGYLFNKLGKVKFNLLLWDIYPDIVIQSGYISRNNPLAKIWAKWNTIVFPKAHRIFTVSANLAREIVKYGEYRENVVIVPNWVNSEEIRPLPRATNPFLIDLKLTNKFIVMYSGNMGKTHDIETIVEAAALLMEHPNIQFLIIGDGEKKPKIQDMVTRRNISNVNLLPFQNPEMFKHSIAAAHIGFVTLSEGFENFSVPSKTYYLMAAGCIIFAIANSESEMEQTLNTYHCGYRFNPGSAGEIAAQIVQLYNDQHLSASIGKNAREAAFHFTIENANSIAREVAQN